MTYSEIADSRLDEGKLDTIIAPQGYHVTEHPSELLFEERHVVVGWNENPLMASPLSKKDFFNSNHVVVSIGSAKTPSFADRSMEAIGFSRRVAVRAPSFGTIPWLVEGTQRPAVLHERLARTMARTMPIAIQELPFELPKLQQLL